jgi:hypothetical protein
MLLLGVAWRLHKTRTSIDLGVASPPPAPA